MRALAQRSAGAAKEIKGLIVASSTQVSEGVGLVADTGQALGRIVAQVVDINDVVRNIASGAQEQATGLAEVNTAINQMDQMTQQNAAMVEETTAASHSLAEKSAQLDQLINRFRLGDNDARRQRAPAAVRVQPAPAPRHKSGATRQAAAARPQAVEDPSEGGWNDF